MCRGAKVPEAEETLPLLCPQAPQLFCSVKAFGLCADNREEAAISRERRDAAKKHSSSVAVARC
jgi:hypothetical protein